MYTITDNSRGFYYTAITLYLILLWLFFVGALTVFGFPLLEAIFSGYTVIAVISSILAILSFFHLLPFYSLFLEYGRATVFFQDPNVFGPFLIPIVVYSIMKMENSQSNIKLCWLLTFLFTSAGVLLSFSRAAWINYFISLFLYIIMRCFRFEQSKVYIRSGAIKYTITLVIAVLAILAGIFAIEDLRLLFTERFGLQSYDQDRFATQIQATLDSMQNPLGIGPGQSELVYDYAIHSLYIRLLAENGLIGFLSFNLFLFATLTRCVRRALVCKTAHQPVYHLFLALLSGILVNSLVIDSLHWRHFWILLALPWGLGEEGSSWANNEKN